MCVMQTENTLKKPPDLYQYSDMYRDNYVFSLNDYSI